MLWQQCVSQRHATTLSTPRVRVPMTHVHVPLLPLALQPAALACSTWTQTPPPLPGLVPYSQFVSWSKLEVLRQEYRPPQQPQPQHRHQVQLLLPALRLRHQPLPAPILARLPLVVGLLGLNHVRQPTRPVSVQFLPLQGHPRSPHAYPANNLSMLHLRKKYPRSPKNVLQPRLPQYRALHLLPLRQVQRHLWPQHRPRIHLTQRVRPPIPPERLVLRSKPNPGREDFMK